MRGEKGGACQSEFQTHTHMCVDVCVVVACIVTYRDSHYTHVCALYVLLARARVLVGLGRYYERLQYGIGLEIHHGIF